MDTPIKIAIVDPHKIVRESLKSIFKDSPDMLFVGETRLLSQMLSLCKESPPDVVVFEFGSKVKDIWLIERLHNLYPQVKVLVLTGNMDMEYAKDAIRAGANGYLYKGIGTYALQQAVVTIHNNKPMFDEDIEKIFSLGLNSNYPSFSLPVLPL